MSEVETKLKELARQLFADSRIDQLLAYETGTLNGRARPCVITMVDDVERLVWNNTCSNNLAVYLPGIFARQPIKPGKPAPEPPKVGIVVKGCDSLSISLLVKEHQVPRDKLVVIGMPCSGIVSKDSAKIMQSCLECRTPVAKDADFQIEGERREISAHPFSSTESFESMAPDERWAYFTEQMNKCIRCYACRQACPNCYCPECFAEQTNPKWIGVSSDLSDTMLYHIGRMFHQAGRCVGCDACVRACPMNVDLRVLTQKLVKDAKELFDYDIANESGSPLLCNFSESDSDSFITNPEK